MKPLPKIRLKRGRDLVWVWGVSLLALLPLWAIWRRSVVSSATPPLLGGVSSRFKPVLSKVAANSAGSYYDLPAKLSPDGLSLARMDNQNGKANGVPPSDLVIYSRNGTEVFRIPQNGAQFFWFGTSLVACDQSSDYSIFSPAAPGASPPYTQTPRNFLRGQGEQSSPKERVFLSSNGSLLGRARWPSGAFEWSVMDMTNGLMVADSVKAGAVAPNPGDIFIYDWDLKFALAPATIKWPKGVVGPVVVVSQVLPRAAPTPIVPTPVVTPAPTPTFSPAQKAFTARKTKEEAEVDKLTDSVLGVDGAEPTVTDPSRVAQITAEVKRRNAALKAEEKRLFPARFRTPTPAPKALPSIQGMPTRPYRIECFDVGRGRRLWQTSVRASGGFTPTPRFSPDGSLLFLCGSARMVPDGSAQDSGIDVLAPATGLPLAAWTFGTTDINRTDDNPLYFLNAPPRVAIRDTTFVAANKSPARIRFFDPRTLAETGYLSLGTGAPTQGLSPDATGNSWLAQQDGATYLLSSAELGVQHFGPFATPSP